ncbi:MAG: hypothetical protein RL597_396 [Pseudomonadota bacterium]
MLEVDTRARRDAPIGLVGIAKEAAPRDRRNFLERGWIGLVGDGPEEQQDRGQRVSLGTQARGTQKVTDLARGFAAMPSNTGAGLDVRPIEFSYTVIAESRPVANGVSARLVPNKPKGEFETKTIAFVALIGDVHEGGPVKECISMENIPKQTLRSKLV